MLNFMGIGAQKCGTTWIAKVLEMHPDIKLPGGKEVHYWNNQNSRSFYQYSSLFSDNIYFNGDITPAYGFISCDIIKNIYDKFPDLRLFYVIRNPMDRAWSSARMALTRAEMTHEEAPDQWFIDHFNSKGSLARGDYECCIRNWRNVFPAEQLLVLRYEDIANKPIDVTNKLLDHFGVSSFFTEQHAQQLGTKVFEGDGVAIRASLYSELRKIYAKKVDSLEFYLQEDLSDWK